MCFWTLQKTLEDSSKKLKLPQNPTEMDSVVNECQNYLSILRNLAIEVKSLLFLIITNLNSLPASCFFFFLPYVSALKMSYRTHVYLILEFHVIKT